MSMAGAPPLETAMRTTRALGLMNRSVPQYMSGLSKQDVQLRSSDTLNAHDQTARSMGERAKSLLFNENGETASSEEVLSLILCQVIGEANAQELAKRLLARFGGIGATLAAKGSSLFEECGSQTECVYFLRSVYLAMRRALKEPLEQKVVLGTPTALLDYLRLSMGHDTSEAVRLLFLDTKNGLLLDEEHSRGTVNHVPIYPRELVKRALEVNASALIIVHNHPSGDPTPSDEDVSMTSVIKRVLKDVGVELHDHVIVGRGRCESMRMLRLI